MNPHDLARTVYLGDRYCIDIYHDETESRVVVETNLISRIRDHTGKWNYYSDEDIPNGRLVFEGVEGFSMTPEGATPNDAINAFEVAQSSIGAYEFVLFIDSVNALGKIQEVLVRISARSFHLEDPQKPGVRIID